LKRFLETAQQSKAVPKPKKEILWPKTTSELIQKLIIARDLPPSQKKENIFLDSFEQAIKDDVADPIVWWTLATYLITRQKDADKCLLTLQKIEQKVKQDNPKDWDSMGYGIKAWQGHMFDLLNKRNNAITSYKEALEMNKGRDADFFGIKIDKEWLEERLKKPFKK